MFHRMSSVTIVNVSAMIVAIVGIVIQIASGVDYPTVPPGPIMLAVAAVLMIYVRRRWVQVFAVVVALFLTVGGLIAPTGRHNLTDPENAGQLIGTVVQLAGVITSLAAGLIALRRPPMSPLNP